jgi:hypothetical protein
MKTYVRHYVDFLLLRNPNMSSQSLLQLHSLRCTKSRELFRVIMAGSQPVSLSLSLRPISCITKKHPDLWAGFASKVM